LILKVLPNGPAAEANLQGTRRDASGQIHLGDVIVAVNGKPINSAKELTAAIEQYKVGDTVTLTIVRDGERQDVQITLQAVD
jgi:VCBS repeat-containing protein